LFIKTGALTYTLSFPPAEEQADREETAGEQGGEAGLHPVVMEEGQQAVNRPGDG
jgi:hypothetical protein